MGESYRLVRCFLTALRLRQEVVTGPHLLLEPPAAQAGLTGVGEPKFGLHTLGSASLFPYFLVYLDANPLLFDLFLQGCFYN